MKNIRFLVTLFHALRVLALNEEFKSMKDINTIIKDKIIGCISEEDDKRLQEWLKQDPTHRKQYERFLKESSLVERYQVYAGIDEKEAWKQFKKQNNLRDGSTTIRRVLQYAAILLLPVLFVTFLYFTQNEEHSFVADRTELPSSMPRQAGKQVSSAQPGATQMRGRTGGGPATWLSQVRSSLSGTVDTVSSVSAGAVIARTKASSGQEEKWLTLEDGTVVHLNHSTSLIYPEHFDADNRTVRLEGEAYFVVAKDRKRPFYVMTSSGVVKEYGTSFNVNTYTPGFTKVVLVEGSISVASHSGEATMMQPGDLAVISSTSKKAEISKVDVMPYVAWNNGRYVFMDTSLEQLMNVIGYWYGLNVHFETETDKAQRFSGDIDRNQDLHTLLNALRKATELQLTVRNRELFIQK